MAQNSWGPKKVGALKKLGPKKVGVENSWALKKLDRCASDNGPRDKGPV